jgi:ABC-2 type transport system permease protein
MENRNKKVYSCWTVTNSMKEIIRVITQYVRVYRALLRINLVKFFTYRADLTSSIIAHFIWASFTIIQMLLLTSKTSHIFNWSRTELLILAGMYNLTYSFFYLFFSRGFNAFSTTIHLGRLDGILTKPIDSQFLMTNLYITYTNLIRTAIGGGFLMYLIITRHIEVTPLIILGTLLLLIFSVMIIYSVWMLVMTLTIWFPKLSNLTDLMYQINQVTKFPQEIYQGASVYLFFTLLPLTLVIVTPAKFLLQKAFTGDVLLLSGFAIGLFLLSRFFWRFALRFYTSASGN